MTWHIWDEYTDHGRARAGSRRRGWSQREKVGRTAWPQATMTGLGLLLALGGVWCMHWQDGHAPSVATREWTQVPLLTHLQAVMMGTLSWCAAVLVVATLFLGLMLRQRLVWADAHQAHPRVGRIPRPAWRALWSEAAVYCRPSLCRHTVLQYDRHPLR
jgi:hypothetical protein